MLSVSLTSSKLLLPVPSNERCGVLGVFVCLCCGAFDWVLAAVCELSLVAASGGYSLVAVLGLLFAVASFVVDHALQVLRLSSCGPKAKLPHGMWDLPGPGIEPMSPALAGGFLATVPPGKYLKAHSVGYLKLNIFRWGNSCVNSDPQNLCCIQYSWSKLANDSEICIFNPDHPAELQNPRLLVGTYLPVDPQDPHLQSKQ